MQGHVSRIDKCGPSSKHQTPIHTHFPSFFICNYYNFYSRKSTTSIIMTFLPWTTCSPSSDTIPSPARPIVDFQLNQAMRDKVNGELEILRKGTLTICLKHPELSPMNRSHTCHAHSSSLEHVQLSWNGRHWRDWRHSLRRRPSSTT